MDKRKFITLLDEFKTLPTPGTILYPPADKINGDRLLRYEIDECGILAVIDTNIANLEIYWTPEQVRMCTWDKIKKEGK